MSPVEPVDPRVRLVISQWPPDAPRGAVTTFCLEHGLSRKTFYAIRRRALEEGQAAALELRSRRPKNSPTQITDDAKNQALAVRAALESPGLDHGPISVHDKMRALRMEAPPIASLARIFRQTGVARAEPKKKPRAAFRRFVYPAPNACWQLDAAEYVLAGGRRSSSSSSPTIMPATPSRLTWPGARTPATRSWCSTRAWPRTGCRSGCSPITGWRSTRRIVAWSGSLSRMSPRSVSNRSDHGRALPADHAGQEREVPPDLVPVPRQTATRRHTRRVAAADRPVQRDLQRPRPHQALPGRITPQQARDATPKAAAPRPKPDAERHSLQLLGQPAPAPHERVDDKIRLTRIGDNGTIYARGTKFQTSRALAGQLAHVIHDDDTPTIFDARGTFIIEHAWPAPETKYVGSGNPRGPRPRTLPPSPMS